MEELERTMSKRGLLAARLITANIIVSTIAFVVLVIL